MSVYIVIKLHRVHVNFGYFIFMDFWSIKHIKKKNKENVNIISILLAYRQLRARRALMLFKDVPLRTRRALSLYKFKKRYIIKNKYIRLYFKFDAFWKNAWPNPKQYHHFLSKIFWAVFGIFLYLFNIMNTIQQKKMNEFRHEPRACTVTHNIEVYNARLIAYMKMYVRCVRMKTRSVRGVIRRLVTLCHITNINTSRLVTVIALERIRSPLHCSKAGTFFLPSHNQKKKVSHGIQIDFCRFRTPICALLIYTKKDHHRARVFGEKFHEQGQHLLTN